MLPKSQYLVTNLRRRNNLLVVLLLVLISASGLALLARRAKAATTWNVSVGNPGACTIADPNCASVKSAVNASSSGDTINVAAGTYNEHDISIGFSLTINGAGASTTIVNAQQLGRVFDTCCGSVNISGLTIKGGLTGSGGFGFPSGANGTPGGGIRNQGSLFLTNCTISNNVTGNGGSISAAVPNPAGVSTNIGVVGSGGQGGLGGGIYNFNGGNVTLRNSTVSNNLTGSGGNGNGNGNGGVGGDGGGVWSNGTVLVINSTVANNQTGAGGPAFLGTPSDASQANIVPGALFSGGAGGEGGGIANGGGALTLQASTIALNQTGIGNSGANGGNGGGVYTGNGSSANIKDTLIANNSVSPGGLGPDVFSDVSVNDQGYNLIGKTDGSTGFTQPTDQAGTIASPLDPKLDPAGLQFNGGPTKTIGLQATSPAVDKGINSFSLTTDQRGGSFARTFDNPSVSNASGGDGTDVGAFEIQAPNACAPDTTPPTITCPPSIATFVTPGLNGAFVNPGSPVASDNCSGVTLNGARNDGKPLNAIYPIGVTVIGWTATDASGNSASCSQNIIVTVPSGQRRPIHP